ncbi:MAG: hypothetical protein ACLS37_13065 [Alistipes sp.]
MATEVHAGLSPSDSTFSIAVEEITAISAMVTVTPTITIPTTPPYSGRRTGRPHRRRIVAAVEQTGSIDWQTHTGKVSSIIRRTSNPNTNYLVVVFGYRKGDHPVSRQTFRTEQGGDPALCEFEFDMITEAACQHGRTAFGRKSHIFGMIAVGLYRRRDARRDRTKNR